VTIEHRPLQLDYTNNGKIITNLVNLDMGAYEYKPLGPPAPPTDYFMSCLLFKNEWSDEPANQLNNGTNIWQTNSL